jgi:serine/threonine-protein kinase RsbW
MGGPPTQATGSFRIQRVEEIAEPRRWLHDQLALHHYSPHDTFAVRTGFEEAVNNAISHGNDGDASKRVTIEMSVSDDQVEIAIEDEGTGFDYTHVEDPRKEENLLRDFGRGVMLIRSFMDKVQYQGCGNRVRLIKYRSGQPRQVCGRDAPS